MYSIKQTLRPHLYDCEREESFGMIIIIQTPDSQLDMIAFLCKHLTGPPYPVWHVLCPHKTDWPSDSCQDQVDKCKNKTKKFAI